MKSRVQVKTADGKSVDVSKTSLANPEQLESLATAIIQQLENAPKMAQKRQVKVCST